MVKIMNLLLRFFFLIGFFLVPRVLIAQASDVSVPFSLPRTQVIDILDSGEKRTYQLYIQTPSGYSSQLNIDKEYPVIYLTDASYNFPMVEGFMRVATFDNSIQPSIIVGISTEKGRSFRLSRTFDYTPIPDIEWKNKTGGGKEFLKFIKKDVFRYIENNYRATPNKRVYIGYSLGGLLGAYALLSEPSMFDNYILVSPSLWYDDKFILRFMKSEDAFIPTKRTKIYLSTGEYETPEHQKIRNNLVADAYSFSQEIKSWDKANIEVRTQVVKGAVHSTAFPEPVARALYWMLKGANKP